MWQFFGGSGCDTEGDYFAKVVAFFAFCFERSFDVLEATCAGECAGSTVVFAGGIRGGLALAFYFGRTTRTDVARCEFYFIYDARGTGFNRQVNDVRAIGGSLRVARYGWSTYSHFAFSVFGIGRYEFVVATMSGNEAFQDFVFGSRGYASAGVAN